MPRSFKTKLVGQIGEHLVVAELGRLRLIATPFSGNVPDIDVLAYLDGKAIPIQVKAIASGTWQFDIKRYVRIDREGQRQIIKGKARDIDPNLVCVFVKVGKNAGEDSFYLLTVGELQTLLLKNYRRYLRKHDGVRPKNPDSLHSAISEDEIRNYKDRWSLIHDSLKG